MIRDLLLLILLFFCGNTNAQNIVYQQVAETKKNNTFFHIKNIVSQVDNISKIDIYSHTLKNGAVLTLNSTSLNNLFSTKPNLTSLQLSKSEKEKPLVLELVRQELFSSDFRLSTNLSVNISPDTLPGIHYRGVIAGDPNSTVAFSVFEDEVMSLIHTSENETFILGKSKNGNNDEYIFYNKEDVIDHPESVCGTADIPLSKEQIDQMLDYQNNPGKVNKCVNVFLECDYSLAQEQGGSLKTANYISGLFNAVAGLYQNEGITVKISEIMVWETEDPYEFSKPSEALDKFRETRTDFNGDLAHLISRGAPVSGGIAWIGSLCSSYNYAYSYIQDFYENLPTYSWSVNVIAHEMGHNLGSPHTHACTWNGDNTPIDGCGSLLGYDEGCSGAIPKDGGTIMSYCHMLSNVGVNFSKGFGQQPGDLIRSMIANADCLTSCDDIIIECPTLTTEVSNIDCYGEKNGSAMVKISGGVAPFTIEWSNGDTGNLIQNLEPGTYKVNVTDAENCLAESQVTISQPNEINILYFVKKESFAGANDAGVFVDIKGGTPPYKFIWSNGSQSQNLLNTGQGTYTLIVTDSKNCISVKTIEVGTEDCENVIYSFPYAESFENNFGIWRQTDSDHTNWTLHSGKTKSRGTGPDAAFEGSRYIYIEASRNFFKTAGIETGCIDFSALNHPALSFNYHMLGESMGSLEVFISVSGGEFRSIWSVSENQGDLWKSAELNLSAFAGKTVRLKIQGITGRGYSSDIALDNIRITETEVPCQKPEFEIQTTDVNCAGFKTGTAMISTTASNEDMACLWSTGATSHNINGLDAGTYQVTVTNEIGCSAYESFEINEPLPLRLTSQKNDATTTGAADGDINLIVTGGVAPYSFEWSTDDTTAYLQNLSVGLYMATVTDSHDCFVTETVEIEEQFSGCMEILTLPYYQSWENNIENWIQDANDDFDWTIHSGRTSSSRTGPVKAFDGDFYAYIEASGNHFKKSYLTSPCLNLSWLESPTLYFQYSMYGSQTGRLSVEISKNGGENWEEAVWSKEGDQGSDWLGAEVDLTGYTGKVIKIRFGGQVFGGLRSDIAIDGILIAEKTSINFRSASTDEIAKNNSIQELNAFPNPISELTQVEFESNIESIIHVTVFDISGKIKKKIVVNSNIGKNTIPVDFSTLPGGSYILKLQNGMTTLTKKLFKL